MMCNVSLHWHAVNRTTQSNNSWQQDLLSNFMELYKEDRPAYDTVEGLLQSVDLFNSTQYTLEELLLNKGLSRLIIDELVTVRYPSLKVDIGWLFWCSQIFTSHFLNFYMQYI